ncbi:MAG: hypothetical protein EAZ99_17130 [Alphaproteobacteria bacterium]|nr:hypothetical protein [Alphaproteobacteria bacterium]TAD87515.1 MAG: hypothetical protein EAZ99_17130 [Alphaproteobacteria bacterium]
MDQLQSKLKQHGDTNVKLLQDLMQVQVTTMQGFTTGMVSMMQAWMEFNQRLCAGLLPMYGQFLRHDYSKEHIPPPRGAAFTDKYGNRAHDINPEKV